MGLFRMFHPMDRRLRRLWPRPSRPSGRQRVSQTRCCRFEQIELRRLLSFTPAPIHIGAVYYEDASGEDQAGDLIEIVWRGGEPNTQLTQLTINTDKAGNGLGDGDPFFDTAPGAPGDFASVPLSIVSMAGIDSVDFAVEDGGTALVLTFTGFDPGERLVLSVDVDEMGFFSANAVCEGREFEGSRLLATFAAPHFNQASGEARFFDEYQDALDDSGLDLPPDTYVPPGDAPRPVRTAGAFFDVTLTPLPITIAGTVYEDINLNNRQDPGDPGLAGVQLVLWELVEGQYVATGKVATTDASGNYLFEGLLPGTYRVAETQPAGYFSIGASAGTVGGLTRGQVTSVDVLSGINLVGGEDSIDNDFAEARPASLSGHVYHDADNDGVMDPGETGIGGVTVRIQYLPPTGPAPAPIEVLTLADGSWSAENLMPGNYRVDEIQPNAYLDGLDAAGTAGGTAHNPGDQIDGIWLASGQVGRQYDFGELVPSSISGQVIADMNGNCRYDAGDRLLSGVTVRLLDSSGNVLRTALTDENGNYSFTGLAPGVYGLVETTPQGYFDGCDHVGTAGGSLLPPDAIIDIMLVSGTQGEHYDFCEILPSSISGRVAVDANGNGVYDPGEVLLSGVTVYLLDASGTRIASTTTDAAGEYQFVDLRPGTYGVEEIQPPEYYDGSDHVGSAGGSLVSPDTIRGITLISGTTGIRYDFYELPPVSLSGFVYVDDNDNGVRNAGEAAIAGVTLMLLDANGSPTGATAVTDAGGFYRFDGLKPGETYGVAEVQPGGYYDGLDTAGTAGGTAHNPGDSITGVLLPVGVDGKNYNFGELRPASIAGRVLVDRNNNGVADPGEPPISGVTIWLLDAAGHRVTSTRSGADGRYQFTNLRPGTYGVEEVQPSGYLDGADKVGSAGGTLAANDRITAVTLGSGMAAVDYDFYEVAPATLSGYVFQDGPAIRVQQGDSAPDPATVRDGRLTPDDKPLAGVVLRLGDATGAPILDASGRPITAVTDAQGFYQFTGLLPGVYTVLENQPDGYTDSIDTPGTNGGVAINPHDDIDPTILSQLAVDPRNDAIVRIPVSAGDVAVMYNFSEVAVVVENVPPIVPPPSPAPTRPSPPPGSPAPLPEPSMRSMYPPALVHRVIAGSYGGGGSGPVPYTWHLSVVNGGSPRRDSDGANTLTDAQTVYFNPAAWNGADMSRAAWLFLDAQGKPAKKFLFGLEGAIPVTGDFDGNGTTDIGVFFDGLWFLDLNGNGVWDDGDLWARLGKEGDQPVTGDWDGDGKTDLGIFGPAWQGDARAIAHEPGLPDAGNTDTTVRCKNVPPTPDEATDGWRALKRTARGPLRADLIDHVFQYGLEGDVAVAGDWNGDGVTNIGLFRNGTWYLDADGNGRWSDGDVYVENLGASGDVPVVGDFNGDGIDDLGVYRNGTWYLDTNGDRRLDAHDKVFHLGGPHDRPVVGDFNNDGVDEIGVYRDDLSPPDQQVSEPPNQELATRPTESTRQ